SLAGAAQPLTAPGDLAGTASGAKAQWPGASISDAAPPGAVVEGRDGGTAIGYAAQVSVCHGVPQAAARSAYLEQVRRIAPPDPPGLAGRDAELAELTRFCLAPDGPPYAWWRAGPWAGKSALLSTFV